MPSSFSPPPDLSRYQGFIFDCDGTLADTMPAHFIAWREALNDAGASFDFTWDLFVSRAGMSFEQTVRELALQFELELDPTAIARSQREHFDELEKTILPVPSVVEFARFVARSHPVSVASGSRRSNVERTLKKVGIRDLFHVIVTPEDVVSGKPDPEMFLLAAEKMGVPPRRCLVLEDGALGFEAARRAKMDYAVVESTPPTRSA